MKQIYSKYFILALISFTLINMSFISNSTFVSLNTHSNRQRILAISDSNSNQTVIDLFNNRKKIDTQNLTMAYIDIENNDQINSLLQNNSLGQKFDEFWIISDKIADQINISDLVIHLISFHLPILIWSSDLYDLSVTAQNYIGLTSCNQSRYSYDNSEFLLGYSNEDNLSLLLNQTLPTILSENGSMKLANCEFVNSAYQILKLEQVNNQNISPVPVLFQPQYKSNIIVSSFIIDKQNNDNQSNISKINLASASDFSQLEYKFNERSITKIHSVNQADFTNFLSTLTYSMNLNWLNIPSFTSIYTNSATNPVSSNISGGQKYDILQTGFQFPQLTPQLLTQITIGSILLGFIGLILYILRKYWLLFLGFAIGIAAVFKVPTRKISVMDVYNNESRQSIIDILNYRKGQGETVRNLARELQIPLPTLLWHLQILEEFELVVKEKVKREVVIIAIEFIEEFDLDLKIFELTFKSDKAKIFYDYLLNLKEGETFTVQSVVDSTRWSARTVIRYVAKLFELEIIETTSNKGYKIKTNYFLKLKELAEINV